jgi:hypothetical protein
METGDTVTETTESVETTDIEGLLYTVGDYEVTITPAVAAKLLERNTNNRHPQKRAIEVYSKDMVAGRWHRTNQGIGFAKSGELVDGQNRLMACIEADTPFTTLMSTGLDPEAKAAVDTGVKRSLANVLRMRGQENYVAAIAAGLSLRIRYEVVAGKHPWTYSNFRVVGATHEQASEFLDQHPTIAQQGYGAMILRKVFPRLPLSVGVAFRSLLIEHGDEDRLADFLNGLITGAELTEGDPRLALRDSLLRMTRSTGADGMRLLGLFIKTWNDWTLGETREVIVLRVNEVVPEVGKLTPSAKDFRERRRRRELEQRAELAEASAE